MSMTKLIYSADFDPIVGVGAELITRQGGLGAAGVGGTAYAIDRNK